MKKNKRMLLGVFFAVLLVLTCVLGWELLTCNDWRGYLLQAATLLELAACGTFLLPKRRKEGSAVPLQTESRKLSKRTLFSLLWSLIAVPLTVLAGTFLLQDKKYYFISVLVILEALIPFLVSFEGRKPAGRELVVLSVLCGLAVAGRAAFAMLPQFKPTGAIVILAGVCFGGEAGFLVGVVSAFVSNFFFGQGGWTVWQMVSFGFLGFLAGILFRKGRLPGTRLSFSLFGAVATYGIYGVIMNVSSVLMWQPNPTLEMMVSSMVMGVPFDLIHAASAACFLWVLSEPFLEKLQRLKTKYGLME